MGSDDVPMNPNELKAQPDMSTTTGPSYPVVPANKLVYLSSVPGVISNLMLFAALENSSKPKYQPVDDFRFLEPNRDVEGFLDSGTLQDFHDGYYELF
ncbi:hypothetical protein BDZ94DRAFT_1261238 [Collybia nuda]|uniref:Uncharacterized protein n=1 Tax=Collybia nuda TaxID=64659 RepID=A0A9P5Y540_9AGAR|nr:hypothetical protein BDZ94DRAFT_1261238 [Collybia nuda]